MHLDQRPRWRCPCWRKSADSTLGVWAGPGVIEHVSGARAVLSGKLSRGGHQARLRCPGADSSQLPP